MVRRTKKDEFVQLLATRMDTDEETAAKWVDGFVATLYENFAAGKGATLPGFGSFYVRPATDSWVFKFTPAQKLRALLGWPSTYKGEV